MPAKRSTSSIDPDGQRWVMQTWSQVADPNLSRADLPGLAGRLTLARGMDAISRGVLTETLRVDTTTHPAHVTAGRPDQQLLARIRLSRLANLDPLR